VAVTVEGTFLLIDKVSESLRDIERQAKKTDDALRGTGDSMDKISEPRQVRNMERMDRQMRNVNRDAGRMEQQFSRTERAGGLLDSRLVAIGAKLAALSRIIALMKFPALIAGVGLAAQGIGALAGAVVGLLPGLADLSALGAALPATFIGVSGAMVTTKFALEGVSEAMGGNKEAMKELTPQAREFVRTMKEMDPLVNRLRGAAQRGLFPGLTAGVRTLAERGAPTARGLLGRFGREVGGAAQRGAERVTRPGTLRDIDVLGRQGARIFNRMTRGALDLADAIRHIAVAARPFTEWLSRTVLGWAEMLRITAQQGRETGRLADFFERARKRLEQVFRIAGNLWNTFRGILRAARPLSDFIFNFFEGATEKWEAFTNSQKGQQRMRRWFNAIRPPLRQFFLLIGDIFKVWVDLTERGGGRRGALTRTLRELRDVAKPLGDLLGSTADALGPSFITALGEFVKLLNNIPFTPMKIFLEGLTVTMRVLNRAIETVPALGTAISFALTGGAVAKLMGGGLGGGGGGGIGSRVGGGIGEWLSRRGGRLGRIGGVVSRASAVPVWVVNMGPGMGLPGPGGGPGGGGWRRTAGRWAARAAPWAARALRFGGPMAAAGGLAYLYSQVNRDLPTEGGAEIERQARGTVPYSPTSLPGSRRVIGATPDVSRGMAMRPGETAYTRGRGLGASGAAMMKDEAGVAAAVGRGHRSQARSHRRLREEQDKTKKNTREMADEMERKTERATKRSEDRLEALRKAFNRKTTDMKQVTSRGFASIHSEMLKYLSRIQGRNAPGTTGLTPGPGRDELRPGATGMRIRGSGLSDTVMVAPGHVAAPGELILNRHTENRINAVLRSHGTTVGKEVESESRPHSAPLQPQVGNPANLPTSSLRHARGGRIRNIVDLGRQLQSQGYVVGEHPAFGGVAPVHTANSYHYRGMAIDVNADAMPGGEMANLDRLNARLRGMPGVVELLWRVADHFDHLHVAMSGGGGLLGNLGGPAGEPAPRLRRPRAYDRGRGLRGRASGAALRRVRRRAQRRLDAEYGGGATGALGAGVTGSNQEMGRQMMLRMGWPASQWPALKELWTRESGWSHTVSNQSSGAHGIPQSLPASKMASEGADYMTNPKTQIAWGLKYIKGRYGSPSSALAWHNSHNWYATGGRIPWFGDGADFVARRPMVIGVGDRAGGERVTVRPAGGGGRQGPLIGSMTINNKQPGDVRNQIVREVRGALKSVRRELEEAGVEDGDLT
jgi:hypothetical protein